MTGRRLVVFLAVFLLGFGSGCSRHDKEEAKRKLRETKQELKQETHAAGQKLKRDAREAGEELRRDAHAASKELKKGDKRVHQGDSK